MKITLSVIKADIGGYVGHSSSHPYILAEAQRCLEKEKKSGLLVDFEMEYTTMPHVMKKIKGRFTKID